MVIDGNVVMVVSHKNVMKSETMPLQKLLKKNESLGRFLNIDGEMVSCLKNRIRMSQKQIIDIQA